VDSNEVQQSAPTVLPVGADLTLALCLALVTLTVYWPGRDTEFINRDDPSYVIGNDHVTHGLSNANVIWAWTSLERSNWHPLTWLSLQLDAQLHGVNAQGFRITNVLLHVANVFLLFCAWRRLTGAIGPSALVAGLFALHPLHVESVAWVSERKDVLSTLFWMLTLLAYAHYVETPGIGRYLGVCVAFALGLTAKPMLVTLPFVLLLLDYWPLGRLGRASLRFAVLEKLPLFVLSAVSCAITLLAQGRGQAIAALDEYPFSDRLANALVSYAAYFVQMIWPSDLAVYYPYEHLAYSDWRVWASALLLASVTTAAVYQAVRRPFLLVGWLWYIGTLVPVIGLVQVGSQARADRYTYIPLVGVFVMIAWSADEIARRGEGVRRAVWAGATAIVLICSVLTWVQVGYWHDSFALWRHALEVTRPNDVAHGGLGAAYRDAGDFTRAVEEYRRAVSARPDGVHARLNLGWCLFSLRRFEEAAVEFSRVLRTDPDNTGAQFQLGVIAGLAGRSAEAIEWYRKVLRHRPDDLRAHLNLVIELLKRGQREEALRHLAEIERDYPEARDLPGFQAAQRVAREKKGE
jgi:tetratricopeptide (TPR) repeat protein